MRARRWVYLYDTKGWSISPSELPAHLRGMMDAPYRSRASHAERAGYFKRTDAYFMEFEWARYFGAPGMADNRRTAPAAGPGSSGKSASRAVASSLPGYAGPCKDTD